VLLPYLILVAMIWAGMRFGMRSVAATGFLVALGANVATSLGYGPFSLEQSSAHVITLQIFLVIALVTSLVVATTASELADSDEVGRLLTYQANHDGLTGLPNRVLFTDHLTAALAAVRDEPDSGIAVVLINLDDFKKINDRYGRPAGDVALRLAAELLGCTVKNGDVLARLGGDEFVVLCRGLAGPHAVQSVATELTLSLASGASVASNQYRLSASIGAAFAHGDDPITPEDLVHRAEIALSLAKYTRGVNFALFDDALEAHSRRRVELAEELRQSIDRGEMSVFYQPVVSIESGRLTEFEALVRWTNRRFGPVGPDEFIPVAEESGFIIALGDWVLEAACTQLAAWRASSLDHGIRVAVNVSARQLSDVVFPDRVRAILAAARFPASALTLEITETAVMEDSETSELVLEDLRQMGVRLSMDDFGTGYSSMSNLRRTPLDVLKIDRSFVAGVGQVVRDTAIVASIIKLGHSFGLDVVAEGIETSEQLGHLARLGCDSGQGFYWSRAVDATTAAAMLGKRFDVPTQVSQDVGEIGHGLARPRIAALDANAPDSAVTAMLRGLLRIRAPHQAARLLQDAALALGGSLSSAEDAGPDALPLDLSLGEGSPVLVEADPMSLARLQIERFLPRLTEDAREAVDLLRHNERTEDASNTDRLTGLANRRVLDRALPGADGSVILIDLDHFKQINDTEGHLAGDAVLTDFGRMLGHEVRTTDVCCRFGGEEFVIIASGMTVTEAVELTVRLRRAWVRAADRPVTFSAGVAAIGESGGLEALAAADRALYRAKELGRDRTETEFEAVAGRDR
jgi:diguanylate cyclase (GGDEF)-like protein